MTGRRTGLRTTILGIATATTILIFTVITLSGRAQASTPNVPGTPHSSMSLSASAPAATACPPGPGPKGYDRTQYCFRQTYAGLLVNGDNVPVGAFRFTATHDLQLNPRSLDYREQVTIGSVTTLLAARGIKVALADSCGITCTPVGNNFPVGEILRNGLHGTLTFRDSVARGHEESLRNSYTWLVLPAGSFPPASQTTATPLFYRCDDMLAQPGSRRPYPPGCVFPQYTPVLTSMASLPQIAASIRQIQGRGGHYGRIGNGHPLHRITDQADIDANRAVLCPPSLPRPSGMWCDEYPFATTREGGNGVPANSRGREFVPIPEQRRQGGRLGAFYNANRVLNEDAFWVSV